MPSKLVTRLEQMHELFVLLEQNSSRQYKESLLSDYRGRSSQLAKDIDYALEILDGRHKIGFTINIPQVKRESFGELENYSLEELLKPVMNMQDHNESSIFSIEKYYEGLGRYLNPLLNREWRLGIGKSQLGTTDITPMLAKKFDFNKLPGTPQKQRFEEYYITEKLDGNRCITCYNFQLNKWKFYSRSGKLLKVQFDMLGMPSDLIYDGEILSNKQIENPSQGNFNALSGALNSKYGNKSDLVYVIFDIVDTETRYNKRRCELNSIASQRTYLESNTKILPVLAVATVDNVIETTSFQLKNVEDKGGEGVMVNLGSRYYEHKRTDSLLKVKSTYTMDMEVIDILPGTGKYEGMVGSLECVICAKNGEPEYHCMVGSGISDYERMFWANNPSKIIGKIVEVAYFSLSQDKNSRGTDCYSLRFPRFKRVRYDKNETSTQ